MEPASGAGEELAQFAEQPRRTRLPSTRNGDDELSLIVGALDAAADGDSRLRAKTAAGSAVSADLKRRRPALIKPLALKDVLDARLLDRVQANTLQSKSAHAGRPSITHTADQLQKRMSEHAVATALQRRPSCRAVARAPPSALTERGERAPPPSGGS